MRDDGRGFDPPRAAPRALLDGHIGLASSEERVRSAGGELVVASRAGAGHDGAGRRCRSPPLRPRRTPRASERAAPGLLLVFFAATALMVGAVMLVLWTDSAWVDAGAIVLLLALLGLVVGRDAARAARRRRGADRMTPGRSA